MHNNIFNISVFTFVNYPKKLELNSKRKNCFNQTATLSPGWESQNLFFSWTAYAFQGERVSQKPIDLDFYHHIMMGSQEAKRSMCSEFCSRRHRAPKISKRVQFSQIIVWDLNQLFQDLFGLRLLGRYFIKPPILLKFTLIFHF